MRMIYTETEQLLLDYDSHFGDVNQNDFEYFAEVLEGLREDESMYYTIELGRCPSTDRRTYTLHSYRYKPEFDYYGLEKINLKILNKENN